MKRIVKGCQTPECSAYQDKTVYRDTESFCSRCGQPLVHICKKCRKIMDTDDIYCIRCAQQQTEFKRKIVSTAVGTAALVGSTVVPAVAKSGKMIAGTATKIAKTVLKK